jgi:hypothetical protein
VPPSRRLTLHHSSSGYGTSAPLLSSDHAEGGHGGKSAHEAGETLLEIYNAVREGERWPGPGHGLAAVYGVRLTRRGADRTAPPPPRFLFLAEC